MGNEQATPQPTPHSTPAVHGGYMAALALAGWGVIVVATFWASPTEATASPGVGAYAFFLLVLLLGRSMAFGIFPHALVTPDAAFFVSIAVCLGTSRAAWLVAFALTLDAALRQGLARVFGLRRNIATASAHSIFPLYFGGVSGALLIVASWLFEVDGRALVANPAAQSTVLWIVPAYGLTFLVLHYTIQGLRLWLEGFRARDVATGMALPGIVVEATLLPLAAITVLIYRPRELITLLLLGTTYLLIHFVFNRLSRTTSELRHRVEELETLHRTGRALAAALELPQIIEAVCRETVEAIPEARSVALSLFDEEGQTVQSDVYDRVQQTFTRELRKSMGSFDQRVLRDGHTLRLFDVRRERGAEALAECGVGSWVGAPLRRYTRIVGLLEARSPEPDAFHDDAVRLLQSIAAQASMAVQNAHLYELATVDGLTGLYVRRYFDQRLIEEWKRSQRFAQAFSVILFDLDDFKPINDSAGHAAGDRVLREVARVLRQALRGIDIAARFGGDEFAVILPRARLLEAYAVAERIRADMRELCIRHEQLTLTVTVSMGVVCFPESGEQDPAALIRAADLALYRAKAGGKNRVEAAWPVDSTAQRPQA